MSVIAKARTVITQAGQALAVTLTLVSALQIASPGFAENPHSEATAPKLTAAQAATQATAPLPALEERVKIDEQKLQIAKDLTDWLNRTLQQEKALVAVVGRNGSAQTRKQDKTGMGHAGLAVYDPRAQSWIVYNLLNDTHGKTPQGSIWRTAPLDFFYGQKGYDKDALILIPDETTQQRIYESILNVNYKKLYFTRDYNLLSAPDTKRSLNCNKWLLLNVVAARIDNYNVDAALKAIHTGFEPANIRLNPLERQIARTKPTILSDELPMVGPIHTVTVESLYRSDLFPTKRFYSGRQL